MPWVRLDDGYPEHPKVDRVGPMAAWLNVCAWAYCARNLTDGFVPSERVARLATVPNPAKLARALVEANLWEPAQGGYIVHDYLAYNPSRAQVMAERARTAERVARYRNGGSNGVTPPDSNGGGNVGSNAPSNGGGNGGSTDAPYPSRIHPESSPLNPPTGGRKASPKPRRERVLITDDDIDELVGKYAEQYGNRAAVREEIDQSLNHHARLKCVNERLYVDGWLRRALNHRPRGWRVVDTRQTSTARAPIDRTGRAN